MIILSKFTSAADANYTKDLLETNNISCKLTKDDLSEDIEKIDLLLINEHDLEEAQLIIENDLRDND